ncbi:protein transport protein SEC16B homolog isoform X1 [Cucurbita maxima]|uniref:Protein transport protein sec16 n=2 Tax=Cucurbita maxima TaxID=3661 RepID=A0A6J1KUF4_CUCMA|nr:protein transport protein SEC16B homolog isoform X1 [Cucurbita maxima]XP_023005250.1 protein transport protein SEC16B homolog isoform X1 [Cucurbita maxima]XP_023005251.1 protein transport protein SEC16B homolog isoform X1 [Cucurbita maxima]
MASNPPPFQVEDQTDEDFFDKLVEDDFVAPDDSGSKFLDGSDSDDAKAFANLSMNDADNTFKDSGGVGERQHEAVLEKGSVEADPGAVGAHAEEKASVVSSNSVGCVSVLESGNDGIASESTSDSLVSKSDESAGPAIKEVGWSSFYADSSQSWGHGFGSYSDFFNDLGINEAGNPGGSLENNLSGAATIKSSADENYANNSVNYVQYQTNQQVYEGSTDQVSAGQDLSSSQQWENLYPGWKFDSVSGQWYQVEDSATAANVQGTFDANLNGEWADVSGTKTEAAYLQTAQSVAGTVTETSTTDDVSNFNQVSQGTTGYPEHMYFDPQYPGWYYDTIAQVWCSLESYNSSIKSTNEAHVQDNENGYVSPNSYNYSNSSIYGVHGQPNTYGSSGIDNQGHDDKLTGSYHKENQQSSTTWQTESVSSQAGPNFGGNQVLDRSTSPDFSVKKEQQKSISSFGTVPSYFQPSQGRNEVNGPTSLNNFPSTMDYGHQFHQENSKEHEHMPLSSDYYSNQTHVTNLKQSFHGGHQSSFASNIGRSSAGRPPHALVTFGFGGKLVVVKDSSSFGNSTYGSQDPVGGTISVLNLMEVVMGNANANAFGNDVGANNYFSALCQQSFPGPLVGGSVGSKELQKWIDERIANCETSGMDYRKGEALRLLLNLLKIGYQHYGKLRSPFGTDTVLRESDNPESAVATLFASAKMNNVQFNNYHSLSHCLQTLPSEGQMRATASEVQSYLVSGRKKEALQCAQEGQLWGPALVLASQLGDQFYIDTVKQMALKQLVAGSPLRTLCLLIAGQPAEVFSTDTTSSINPLGGSMAQNSSQFSANSMLDDWEKNLAVITANRTKDDELVIIHLGDSLWKERSEITAAHICYLVAEANFESYSDSARLCLIGADHWKFPRTYASPEAIQRTELYEYSKVLGNSQFILLPFQPYKLIYAYMLAEVGKVSDSLKYCQAVLKSLKTGRAPEVETWKQLLFSLDERIRAHQQGGYTANLAPGKLVGKLLNFFDSTAHRVVGGLPPPAPSNSHGNVHGNEHYHEPVVPRVSTSQSTMAMSSLIPSASMEPISEWTTDSSKMTVSNRSVSEPDFGRTPRQQNHSSSSKESISADGQGKTSDSRASRFARFGFGSQLLQKTVGLVLGPRADRQAKLGEKNKFYYDEKLKRWVEEGVESPAEEAALPPPPTTTTFQNGGTDYNLRSVLKKEAPSSDGNVEFPTPNPTPVENSSGIPPIPPSSNQFSARGRMGVRSRYVDTFNQGNGSSANLFQSPPVPSIKPKVAANAKFFVPSPAMSAEPTEDTIQESSQEDTTTSEHPSTSTTNDSFSTPSSTTMPMQRFPSMGNMSNNGANRSGNGPLVANSRRTASWSGANFSDALSPPRKPTGLKPLGEALGIPPSSFMPSEPPPSVHTLMNGGGGGMGDDLHEVEL